MTWTGVYKRVPTGYVGLVEELPEANTQGAPLDVNRVARAACTVPRHREIDEFLVAKICKDLAIPRP